MESDHRRRAQNSSLAGRAVVVLTIAALLVSSFAAGVGAQKPPSKKPSKRSPTNAEERPPWCWCYKVTGGGGTVDVSWTWPDGNGGTGEQKLEFRRDPDKPDTAPDGELCGMVDPGFGFLNFKGKATERWQGKKCDPQSFENSRDLEGMLSFEISGSDVKVHWLHALSNPPVCFGSSAFELLDKAGKLTLVQEVGDFDQQSTVGLVLRAPNAEVEDGGTRYRISIDAHIEIERIATGCAFGG